MAGRPLRAGRDIIVDDDSNERLVTDDLKDLLNGWSRPRSGSAVRTNWPPSPRFRRGASYQRQRQVAEAAGRVTWSRWSTRW